MNAVKMVGLYLSPPSMNSCMILCTGMDAKQVRSKADQVVSSVSAAPTLVNNIKLSAPSKRRLSLQEEALVDFSSLVFWRLSESYCMAKVLCVR
jgi:hypothetical protein